MSIVAEPVRAMVNELPFDRLPSIDYSNHPAYGGAFPPTVGMRLKALCKLLPWMSMVAARRMVLFDRVPPLQDYDGPMSGGVLQRVMKVPKLVPGIARVLAAQMYQTVVRPKLVVPPEAKWAYDKFSRDGVVTDRLTSAELDGVRSIVNGPLNELIRRREQAAKQSFEGNQFWFKPRDYAALYELLNKVLERTGFLAVASAYRGHPVSLKHLLLQVNDARDSFPYNKFRDVNIPDPATNYMHIDTQYDLIKCAIYLQEVDDDTGPFCYVLGSNRLKVGAFEGLVRRAMDRSGLSGYAPPVRALFSALPGLLRKKCTFGSDMLDTSPDTQALVDAEYRFTSADGDIGMFDNLGIHRGALARKGERRVLFLTLS